MRGANRWNDRGLVLPSWAVAASAVAVVVALVGFGVSGERDPEVTTSDSGDAPASTGPDHRDKQQSRPDAKNREDDQASQGPDRPHNDDKEPVERRTAYVEVYNNSGITGLAGETTASLQDMGWPVVATDNWYGEIPADTVYHPSGLAAQAELLADDLGVGRIMPSVAPMRFDRLTVILTGSG